MSTLDEIINNLTDSSKTLLDPILKTKVLATRMKNAELLAWADQEMIGYSDSRAVPCYRYGKSVYYCSLQQPGGIQENASLPLLIFDEEIRDWFLKHPFTDGVAALESMNSRGS